MPENNERIAALETKMEYTLGVLSKREEYQTGVLIKLDRIETKQDQALTYQKTCDAERSAYGTRLGLVENELEANRGFRKALRTQAVFIAGLAAFAVSVLTVYAMMRHGL